MSLDRSTVPFLGIAALVVTTAGVSAIAEAQPLAGGHAAPHHSGSHAAAQPPPHHAPPGAVAAASASASASAAASASASASAAAAAPPPPETPDVQPPPARGAENIGAPPANAISTNPVAQLGTFDAGGTLFGHVGLGASYDKPAAAMTVGSKLQLSPGWMVGLDGEWNPWVSLDTKKVRNGVLNIYGSVVRRYQMRYEAVNLRTTVGLGASVLLFDLYGAHSGSVGPFVGVSFLGIEWKLAKGWYLVIDPSYLAFPIPHITGAPLGYIQYRVTFGLEVAFF